MTPKIKLKYNNSMGFWRPFDRTTQTMPVLYLKTEDYTTDTCEHYHEMKRQPVKIKLGRYQTNLVGMQKYLLDTC